MGPLATILTKALVSVGMLGMCLAPQLVFGDIGQSSDFPHDTIILMIDEDSTGKDPGYGDPARVFLDTDVNDYLDGLGLRWLLGKLVCAMVHDGDIGISYGVTPPPVNSASSSLPELVVTVLNADTVCSGELKLLADAPLPVSSSDPFDVQMDP